MTIVAKFSSTCPNCNRSISIGERVTWVRGAPAAHIECPQASEAEALADRATSAVDAAMRTENMIGCTELFTAIVNGDAEGNAVLAQAALDIIEAKLTAEFEAALAPAPVAEVPQAFTLQKGIYRVSLRGSERRYGVDYLNLQVTPNEKYKNLKVSEWRGESIGTYSAARGFRYWPSVDPTGTRTLAIRAAFDILAGSADPVEYARAYSVESSSCYRCGLDLVDDISRARMLGPECAKLVG